MNAKFLQTAGYFSAFFILGSVIASLGPTLPELADQVSREPGSLGYLFSIRSLGYLSGSLLGGYLYEKTRGHLVLGAGLIILALALAAVPLNPLLILLVILLYIAGAGLGALDVGSNTLLARVHGEDSGPYLNAMYLLAGLGSMAAPLYLYRVNFRAEYWGLSLLAGLGAAWLLLTPSPVPPNRRSETPETSSRGVFLVVFCVLSFLFVGVEISYGGWIFTYAQIINAGNPQSPYLLTSLFWTAITAGRLVSIPVSAVLTPSLNVFLLLGSGVLSSALTAVFPTNPAAVWVGTAGMGLSLSALFPTTFRFIRKRTALPEKTYGIVWASGSLGGMLLPWLSGEFLTRAGPPSLMGFFLASWLAASVFFFGLTRIQDPPSGPSKPA